MQESRVSSKNFYIIWFQGKKTINRAYKDSEKSSKENKNFNPNKKIYSNIQVLSDK